MTAAVIVAAAGFTALACLAGAAFHALDRAGIRHTDALADKDRQIDRLLQRIQAPQQAAATYVDPDQPDPDPEEESPVIHDLQDEIDQQTRGAL